MPNETIIAVPITVEEKGQVRLFLVRLVEKLDIVLGYRGGDPYVSSSQLQSTTEEGLTALEQTVLNVITELLADSDNTLTTLITSVSEATTEAIDELKSPDVIGNADDSGPTLTTPPTQGELQAMQDQIAANASDFNDLLVALRGTGIIAT